MKLALATLVVAASLMTVWVGAGIVHVVRTQQADYFIFLESARQHLDGQSAYEPTDVPIGPKADSRNLNHPAFIVLTLPLARVPAAVGFTGLLLVGAACVAVGARRTLREFGVVPTPRIAVLIASAAILTPGIAYNAHIGQVGLVVALGIVFIWVFVRHSRWLAAGVLMGVVAVFKPFLVPLFGVLVVRRRSTAVAAGVLAAIAVSLLALPFVGWATFNEWLSVLGDVDWVGHPLNVSMVGLIERLTPGTVPDAAAWAVTIVVMAVAGVAVFLPPPQWLARPDRDVAVLLIACVLASPLGWLYYTPLLLPAAVAVARVYPMSTRAGRVWLTSAAGLLWVPYFFPTLLPDTPAGAAVSGVHTYGLLVLLAAVLGLLPLGNIMTRGGGTA